MSVNAPPRSPRATHRSLTLVWFMGAAALAAVLAGAVAGITRLPGHVDRVVLDNPHEFDIAVDVSAEPGGPTVSLGAADHDERTVIDEVLDAGDVWVFRFSYAGVDAGEVALRRTTLERTGWQVRVPDSVAARLRAAGFGPSD